MNAPARHLSVDFSCYAATDPADADRLRLYLQVDGMYCAACALKIEQAGSILAYDVAAARQRLEKLDWVQSAQVTRALPDGLTVTIRERAPFEVDAFWTQLRDAS